jgi:hypothetical protein
VSAADSPAVIPGTEAGLSYTSAPGRSVLLATVLGSAMASIDATVVGIALPAMGRDFGASLAGWQWIVTAYPRREAGPTPQPLLHCGLDAPASRVTAS